MDRYTRTPEDLREEPGSGALPSIPRNIAVAAAVILIISGMLIGIVLPELTGSDGKEHNEDPAAEGLTILLSCSVDRIVSGDTVYDNVPVPVAFQIIMLEGDPVEDLPGLEGVISPMMEYIFGNGSGAQLKVIPGAGWETGTNPIEIDLGYREGDSDHEHTVEVPVGLGDQEITLYFELRVWEVEEI